MALTRVQATPKAQASSTATVSMTFATPPTVGNAIVVGAVQWGGTAPTGCADNRGNTYTAAAVSGVGGSARASIFVCAAVATSAGPFTVTVTAPAGAYWLAVAIELAGVGSGLALDQAVTNHTGTGAIGTTGATAALSGSEVALVAVQALNGTQASITVEAVTPPWIQEAEELSFAIVPGEIDSRIRTGVAGTTQSCSWTNATAGSYAAALAAFKAGAPALVTVPNVVGQSTAAASTAITAAGLIVGTITSTPSATVPADHVISQTPAAGASVAPGSAVALVVATAVPGLVVVIAGDAWPFRVDTLDIRSTINGRDTLSGELAILDSTPAPTIGQEIVVTYDGVRIFGGVLQQTEIHAITGDASKDLAVALSAEDFNSYADRRYVTLLESAGGLTLKAALELLVPYLSTYGVALSAAQVNGPTLPAFRYEYQRVTDVLNELSTLTGYVWEIDYNKHLRMWEPGDVPAPFDIADGDGRVMGDIIVSPQDTEYANRVILRVGPTTPADHVFGWNGNGTINAFQMYFPIVHHYNFVWVRDPLPDHSETLGAVGSGALWEFHPAVGSTPAYLSRVRGAPPATDTGATNPGNMPGIQLQAFVNWPYVSTADDAAGQAARGLTEILVDDPTPVHYAYSDAKAQGLLEKYTAEKRIVQYTTREHGLHVGQTQTMTIARRALAGDFLITDLTIRTRSVLILYEVTLQEAATYQGSWRDVYKLWGEGALGTGGGGSGSSGTVSTAVAPHHGTHEPGGTDPLAIDTFTMLARRDVANTFAAAQTLNSSLTFVDASQPANTRVMRVRNGSQLFIVEMLNDANVSLIQPLVVNRVGDISVARDLYEKGRSLAIGSWAAIPFNAANFTSGAGGTFTVASGNVLNHTYWLIGRTLTISLYVINATIGGAPTVLKVALPPGMVVANYGATAFSYQIATAFGTGMIQVAPGDSVVNLYQDVGGATPWPAGTFLAAATIQLQII